MINLMQIHMLKNMKIDYKGKFFRKKQLLFIDISKIFKVFYINLEQNRVCVASLTKFW